MSAEGRSSAITTQKNNFSSERKNVNKKHLTSSNSNEVDFPTAVKVIQLSRYFVLFIIDTTEKNKIF